MATKKTNTKKTTTKKKPAEKEGVEKKVDDGTVVSMSELINYDIDKETIDDVVDTISRIRKGVEKKKAEYFCPMCNGTFTNKEDFKNHACG